MAKYLSNVWLLFVPAHLLAPLITAAVMFWLDRKNHKNSEFVLTSILFSTFFYGLVAAACLVLYNSNELQGGDMRGWTLIGVLIHLVVYFPAAVASAAIFSVLLSSSFCLFFRSSRFSLVSSTQITHDWPISNIILIWLLSSVLFVAFWFLPVRYHYNDLHTHFIRFLIN